jgi:uncharacterized protein HemY
VVRSRLGYYLAVWGSEVQGDEALALLRDAAAERPQEPELQANLGWGAHRMGLQAEAQSALEAALALDPLRHRDRVRLARVLAERGERERALALVREALAGRPAEPWSDEARALAEDLEGPVDAAGGGAS